MSAFENDPKREQLDRATAGRLARLRAMPVDLPALRKAVESQAGFVTVRDAAARAGRPLLFRLPGQVRALAASLLVAGLVMAGVLLFTGGPVLASADRLARIHHETVAGGGHGWRTVDTIGAANAVLASQHPGAPAVPDVGGDGVLACCVHTVGRKKMSCVSFKTAGEPVSMAVADAQDVRMPAESQTVAADGATYYVQSAQGVNMVMARRGGRWVCLMGKLPPGRLIDLARNLRF